MENKAVVVSTDENCGVSDEGRTSSTDKDFTQYWRSVSQGLVAEVWLVKLRQWRNLGLSFVSLLIEVCQSRRKLVYLIA